jgi:CheY-like chemotaxis protein
MRAAFSRLSTTRLYQRRVNAILRAAGYEITSASSFYQALERLQENRFDLVLVGRSIPGVQLRGFLELAQLKARSARTMVLRDSSQASDFQADYLHDPDQGPEALLNAIRNVFVSSQVSTRLPTKDTKLHDGFRDSLGGRL